MSISVNGPVGGMEYPMITFNGPRPEEDGTYTARTKYGLQLQRMGRDEEASEEFRVALESNPYFTLARRRRAQLLNKAGERDAAVLLLREGLELQPTSRELASDLKKLEQR